MKGGFLVSYINKDGQTKKGMAMRSEQKPEFIKLKKTLVKLCSDDFKPIIKDEKQESVLVLSDKLKVIGFIDWNMPAIQVIKSTRKETEIQTEFFDKVKLFFPKLPDKLIFAVPNGGSRNPIEARNLKLQGVKSGVSDVIILIPKQGFASLCLEFKTQTGKQSDEQKEFQLQAEACGSKYVIVRSVASAIEVTKEYLK